jgi:hypothetical protein
MSNFNNRAGRNLATATTALAQAASSTLTAALTSIEGSSRFSMMRGMC